MHQYPAETHYAPRAAAFGPMAQGDHDVQRLPRLLRPVPAASAFSAATAALFALALLLQPSVALAQSRVNEGSARALQKKAMEDDYLNTDFDKAAEKLNQAIAKCGNDKCGVPVRASLKRDLAAVQSAAGHKEQALTAMTEAFKIDAGLQLDPNYKTKELEAIYAEAKKAAASGASSGPPPAGDFTHIPPAEQQVRTPIPIYVEYTGSETLKRVQAKYKGVGMTEWKTLELKSLGGGFGATTACADSQIGDFVYFIQGFNDQNDPVASGGDRQNPYKVAVKSEAPGDPPHLPGQSPPTQCADKGDCPPGLPGCKAAVTIDESLKKEGESCEEDNECRSSSCRDLKCTAPPEDTSAPKRKKWWIGVAADFDFSFLSSAQDVCQLYLPAMSTSNPTIPFMGGAPGTPTNTKGYYCTQNGSDYPSHSNPAQAAALVPGQADSVGGGIIPGNIRILASLDYALTTNMMLGIRAGYVARAYTGTQAPHFPPFHVEARYTYVFGDDPIGKAGIHPMVYIAAGAAPYDSSVSVAVYEKPNSVGCPTGALCQQQVSAWQTGGPLFFAPAGGARWEFVPGVAAMADLKLALAIGGSAGFRFVPTPEVAMQFGF